MAKQDKNNEKRHATETFRLKRAWGIADLSPRRRSLQYETNTHENLQHRAMLGCIPSHERDTSYFWDERVGVNALPREQLINYQYCWLLLLLQKYITKVIMELQLQRMILFGTTRYTIYIVLLQCKRPQYYFLYKIIIW